MNTDTKKLVKKAVGTYALIIRKAHKHWAFSDEELEKFVSMIRSDEREACAKLCERMYEENTNAWGCAESIRARSKE